MGLFEGKTLWYIGIFSLLLFFLTFIFLFPPYVFPSFLSSPPPWTVSFCAHELVCFVIYCYKTKYWTYMCKSTSSPTCRLRSNVSLVGVNQGWNSVLYISVEKFNTRHMIEKNELIHSLFEQLAFLGLWMCFPDMSFVFLSAILCLHIFYSKLLKHFCRKQTRIQREKPHTRRSRRWHSMSWISVWTTLFANTANRWKNTPIFWCLFLVEMMDPVESLFALRTIWRTKTWVISMIYVALFQGEG